MFTDMAFQTFVLKEECRCSILFVLLFKQKISLPAGILAVKLSQHDFTGV